MKKLLGLLLLFSLSTSATQVVKETVKIISSPDGAYEFVFYQKQLTPATRQMYYTLTYFDRYIKE